MTVNTHQILHFIPHFFSARRNGHGIHSPFAYQLCEEVFYNHYPFYDLNELGHIRTSLLTDDTTLSIDDFGAGSKTFKSKTRQVKDLAAKGISTVRQSEIFYRLINFLNCKSCVELGTSLGLNTLYLAKGNAAGQVTSLEGSPELSHFATALAQKANCTNISFINARFDAALPELLHSLHSLDLLYVDGNHTYDATLRYFELALHKKHNHSVFIFDDIYWSKGMTQAWREIKQNSSVTLSIDCFYFGLVFFRNEIKEKVDLKLYL